MTESPIWPAEGEPPSLSEPPERSSSDYVHAAAKVGLNLVPNFGGALAELFVLAVAAPLEKRREDWIRRIAEGLEELQQRFEGFDPARLPENEAFVSTAYQATQAVMRTHHEEKREALRNAVLNAALHGDIDADLQHTFVGLLDTLTPTHLRLLRLFDEIDATLTERTQTLGDLTAGARLSETQDEDIRKAEAALNGLIFPWLAGPDQSKWYQRATRDLHANGLIDNEDLADAMSARSEFDKRTTALGVRFLKFIASPIGDGQP